jgi:hypothetical protein
VGLPVPHGLHDLSPGLSVADSFLSSISLCRRWR